MAFPLPHLLGMKHWRREQGWGCCFSVALGRPTLIQPELTYNKGDLLDMMSKGTAKITLHLRAMDPGKI